MHWTKTADRLPEPNKKVLIVRDVRKWDQGRAVSIDIARTGFLENETIIGGPKALTGYHKMKGVYFAVPAVLHPESVTHWMELPSLPNDL
ncbi:Domain of unknown function DUF551 [Spirosomataceae bacterium]|jgi:hypothetical protein